MYCTELVVGKIVSIELPKLSTLDRRATDPGPSVSRKPESWIDETFKAPPFGLRVTVRNWVVLMLAVEKPEDLSDAELVTCVRLVRVTFPAVNPDAVEVACNAPGKAGFESAT